MSNTITLISQSTPYISAKLDNANNGTLVYTYIDETTQVHTVTSIAFFDLIEVFGNKNPATIDAAPQGSTNGTFTLCGVSLSYDTSLFSASELQAALVKLLSGVQIGPVPVFITKEQYGTLTLDSEKLSYQIASGHDNQYGTAKHKWSVTLSDLKDASISVTDKTFSVNGHRHYRFSTRLFSYVPHGSAISGQSTATTAMTMLLQCFINAVKLPNFHNSFVVLNNTTGNTVTFELEQDKTPGALPFVNPLTSITSIESGDTNIIVTDSSVDCVLTQSDGSPLWYFSSGSAGVCLLDISTDMTDVMAASANALENIMAYPSSNLAQAFQTYTKNDGNGPWVVYQFEQVLASQSGSSKGALLPQLVTLQGYQLAKLQAWSGTYYLYGNEEYIAPLVISSDTQASYDGQSLSTLSFKPPASGKLPVFSSSSNQGTLNLSFYWLPANGNIGTKSITKACSGTIVNGKSSTKVVGYADKIVTNSPSSSPNYLAWALTIGGLLAYFYEIYKWVNGQSTEEPEYISVEELEQEAQMYCQKLDTGILDTEANEVSEQAQAQANALQQENAEGYDVSDELDKIYDDIDDIQTEVLPEKPDDATGLTDDSEQLQALGLDACEQDEAAEQGIESELNSQSSAYQQAKAQAEQAETESEDIKKSLEQGEEEAEGDDGEDGDGDDGGGIDADTEVSSAV